MNTASHRNTRKIAITGLLAALPLALGLMLGSGPAVAGAGVFDLRDTCTSVDCLSQAINGTVVSDTRAQLLPFTIQVLANAGECLRLNTTVQQADLAMVVISPDGTVWRNDDQNGAANRAPLIKINGTPTKGWYTIQLSSFNGSAIGAADFVLRYGRYNVGNPNCAAPTLSLN